MKYKSLKRDYLEQLIAETKAIINKQDKYVKEWDPSCLTVEGRAFQKYIEIQSVADVASWMNEEGYRIPTRGGERKYISNDITALIMGKEIDVDGELQQFARKIHLYMKGKTRSFKVE